MGEAGYGRHNRCQLNHEASKLPQVIENKAERWQSPVECT